VRGEKEMNLFNGGYPMRDDHIDPDDPSGFQVGDHVENVPATVDGIVYQVDGETIRFADEYVTYRMRASDLRQRYEPFKAYQVRAIKDVWPALF